ncbi:MAG: lipopolysaccharide biosynthesis protein [Gammaproteobacteria bacterium]|nr:lipopolysaccharide biosynthesis protein [Gammaproteobacteria bacterium]
MTGDTGTPESLAGKTVRAAAWSYTSFALGKGIVVVTLVVLARLLAPEEFGVVGFATLVVAYLSILQDLGLSYALIQRRENIAEASNTVFTLNLVIGAVLALATFAAAPLVAAFFREPLVESFVKVLALTFLIEPLGSVHIARLQRELKFGLKLVPDIGRAMTKGIVGISLAFAGFGPWSLIFGQLAGVIAAVVLAWLVYPWRPRLRVEAKIARSLLTFSLPLILVSLQHAVETNIDYTIIGRVLGDRALGIYTLAYRIPELTILSIGTVLSSVVFPAFSAVQADPAKLKNGFLATLRYVPLVTVLLALALLFAADPLVRVLLGRQWLEAVPILKLLAVYAVVDSIGFNVGDVYKAIGRPSILWKWGFVYLAVLIPCLLVGARYGLVGIAVGHIVAATQFTLTRLYIATRVIDVSYIEMLRELRPAFVAALGFTTLAWPMAVISLDWHPALRLIVMCCGGGCGGVAALWFMDRETVRRALTMARTVSSNR